MALTRNLQIHKDAKSLMSAIDSMVVNMKRDHKFNIGSKMFNTSMEIAELIGHANRQCGHERVHTLNIILEKLDHLEFLVEYCTERNYIQIRVSSNVIYILDKVSKQATGWRNYSKTDKGINAISQNR